MTPNVAGEALPKAVASTGGLGSTLVAHNWRLKMDEKDLLNLLPGVYYMDPPDGGSVTVIEQLQRMAKDAERYRKLRRSHLVDVRIIGTGMRSGERLDSAVDALPVFVLPNGALSGLPEASPPRMRG